MEIEGFIQFENAIPVENNCLGKKFSISIGGIKGFLATPAEFQKSAHERQLGSLQIPALGSITYNEHFHWGSLVSLPEGYGKIRACKLLFENITEEELRLSETILLNEISRWRTLLLENLSVRLISDYRGVQKARSLKSYGLGEFGLFRVNNGKNERVSSDFKNSIVIEIGETKSLDCDEFQILLDDTSNGKCPLLPFYFLLDADRAIFEENYRKSVLDCATAIEVCFSLVIGHNLSVEDKLKNYLERKHNSLRLKRSLLKALGLLIPNPELEYDKHLDKVRNRVIHGGYDPTREEARKAFKLTQDTLYYLLSKIYEL